eukprot:COSAG01_NODE_3463_length_6066_cov_2.711916_3_plen_166_part_00
MAVAVSVQAEFSRHEAVEMLQALPLPERRHILHHSCHHQPPYAHPPLRCTPPQRWADGREWLPPPEQQSKPSKELVNLMLRLGVRVGCVCGARYGQQREGGVQIFTWCRDTAALFNHSTTPNFGGGDGHPGEQGTVSHAATVSLSQRRPTKAVGRGGSIGTPPPP